MIIIIIIITIIIIIIIIIIIDIRSDGNRTEWSLIRSVIIRVIRKSDHRAGGVRFVYHEYDYRLNWTTRRLIIITLLKLHNKMLAKIKRSQKNIRGIVII